MGKLRRRFGFERLESRLLMAADFAPEISPRGNANTGAEAPFAASIDIDAVQGLRAASVEIRFDQDKFKADQTSVRAGSAWGGKGLAIANVNNDEGTINIFLFAANETDGASGSLIEIDFQRHESPTDDQPPKIDVESLRINDGDPAMVSAIRDSQLKILPPGSGGPPSGDAPQIDQPLSGMVDAIGEVVVQRAAPPQTDVAGVAGVAIEPMVNASPTGFQAPPAETDEPTEGVDHESAAAPTNFAPPAAIETAPPGSLTDNQEAHWSVTPLQHPPAVCIPVGAWPMIYGPDRMVDEHFDGEHFGEDRMVDEHFGDDFGGAQSSHAQSPMPFQSRGDELTLAAPSGGASAMLPSVPEAKTEPLTLPPHHAVGTIPPPSKTGPLAVAAGVKWAKRIAGIASESVRPSRPTPTVASLPMLWKIVGRGAADSDDESSEDTTV